MTKATAGLGRLVELAEGLRTSMEERVARADALIKRCEKNSFDVCVDVKSLLIAVLSEIKSVTKSTAEAK